MALIADLASFGAAGLMGAMWLWERKLSRLREEQLGDAHGRIMRDEERLSKLTHVVEQNTTAMTRFNEIQRELCDAVKDFRQELHHVNTR